MLFQISIVKKENDAESNVIDFVFHAKDEGEAFKQANTYFANWIAQIPIAERKNYFASAPEKIN